MAASAPISLAAVNIFKTALFVWALLVLVFAVARRDRLAHLRTPVVVLAMLAALALSLVYTSAPMERGVMDLVKYGKLLAIPLILVLLPTRRHALVALGVYAAAQAFVVMSSYLLSMDVALPWVLKAETERTSIATVSSSYLDQSIMTACLAAVAWHLRHEVPGRYGAKLAGALAALCAVNVLLLLPGRSGQLALLAAMALALSWVMPPRHRVAAVIIPLLLVAAIMGVSPHFRDRALAVVSEAKAYNAGDPTLTSSGLRLNFWHRALQAIAERPLAGHGVGSWNTEFRRLEGPNLKKPAADVRNPHQEYLMWAVQLGMIGFALFVALLATIVRDASRFPLATRHATYSVVAILGVVCLFNSTLYDAFIGDYFCVLLGLLLAAGVPEAAAAAPPPAYTEHR